MSIVFASQSLDSIEVRTQLYSMLENGCAPTLIVIVDANKAERSRKENDLPFFKKVLKKLISLLVGPIYYPSYKSVVSQNSQVITNWGLSEESNLKLNDFIKNAQKVVLNEGVNSDDFLELVKKQNTKLIISTMCGLIKKRLLSLGIPVMNVHTSKLPAFKGMNCVEWAIWYDKDIWCTHHRMAVEIDGGDLLMQYNLEGDERRIKGVGLNELRKLYFHKAFKDFGFTVSKYLKGEISFVEQIRSNSEFEKQYYSMHKIMRDKLQEKLNSFSL